MPATLEVVGTSPSKYLNTNEMRRWNHFKVAAQVALWRRAGWACATNALGRRLPPETRAHVQLYLGTTRPNQRRDPMNWYPTVKALLDGFTDAGLWVDDDSEHVKVLEPIFTTDLTPMEWRVHIAWEAAPREEA